MYCAACGKSIDENLNYCKNCGARIERDGGGSGSSNINTISLEQTLSRSLAYLGGFGLLGFIFVALVLVKNDVTEKALIFISLFYLGALFGICSLIIQQIKGLHGKSLPGKADFLNSFQTGELKPAVTGQLEEHREPVMSVTDHTTRTLNKVRSKI